MTIPTKQDVSTNKLTIPLQEKVYTTEAFQDRSQNLVAVGLRSSVVIIELLFDELQSHQVSDQQTGGGRIDYQIVQKINHDSRVQCFAWSPQTSLTISPKSLKFATGGADYNVRIFSSDLGNNEGVRLLRGGHSDYVNALAYQPTEGSQLVSGSDDHTVVLWDSNSGQRLHTITFKSAVMALSWHPEEVSKLMIAEKNGVVHLFNIVSYHPILSLDCGTSPLLSADWSLYNNLLIAASVRSDVIIWDISKMAPITKKYMRQDNVRSVRMCPTSESVLATAGQPNYSVKISNIKNAHITPLVTNQPIGGISWHPVKNFLIVGHDENVSVHHVPKKLQ